MDVQRAVRTAMGHALRPELVSRPTPSLPKLAWLERPVLPDTPPKYPDVDVDLALSLLAAQFIELRNVLRALADELAIDYRELAALIFEKLNSST